MTTLQIILTVAALALVTFLTRALPFFLFPPGKRTPQFIVYLGAVLPYAVIGMLVVYCFRSVSVAAWPHGIPEAIAGTFVVVMHRWRHNLLLSIGGGTAVYMVLVQLVF